MKKAFRRGLLPLILAAAMTVAASAWFVVSRSVTLADSCTATVSITAEAVETGTGERYPISTEGSFLPAGTYDLTVKNDGAISAAYVLTVEDAAFSGDLETGRSDSAELTCYQSARVSVTPLWSAESGHSLLDGHIVVGEAPSQPEVTGESSGTGE